MVCSHTRQSGGSLGSAWIAPALLVCAAVLVPWAAILFLTLPRHYGASHWQLAWGGFDVGLGIALANTAIAALHRSPRGEVAAAVTGTLLICDAWFDVLTSHGSADVAKAVSEAALIELPLAALCFWIVRSARRRGEQRGGAPQLTVAMDRHPGVGSEEVQPRQAWAELLDDADELVTGRERRLRPAEVRTGAHQRVAEPHARGQNPDEDLPRTRPGERRPPPPSGPQARRSDRRRHREAPLATSVESCEQQSLARRRTSPVATSVTNRTAGVRLEGLAEEASKSRCEVVELDDRGRESQLYWVQRVG